MHIYIYKVNFFQNKLYTIKFFYNKIFIEYYVLFIYILRIIEELFNGYFYFFEILFKFPRMKLFVTKKKKFSRLSIESYSFIDKKDRLGKGTVKTKCWNDGGVLLVGARRQLFARHTAEGRVPCVPASNATSLSLLCDQCNVCDGHSWRKTFVKNVTFIFAREYVRSTLIHHRCACVCVCVCLC